MKRESIAYIAFLMVFLVLALIQINKPLLHEQTFFAYSIKNVAQHGVPMLNEIGYGFNKITALWHPPLFVSIVACFIKIFGYNLFSLKISGIIFTALTSLLILLIGNQIFPKKRIIGVIAAGLYLLHPFVIQSALFLDIDGGILTFITTLSIYEFLKNKLSKPWLTGLILFIIVWTKFTSFVILPAVFFLYILFFEKGWNKKLKKIGKLILICFIVTAVFLILFYMYTLVVNLDFAKPFTQNTIEKFRMRFSDGLKTNLIRWGSVAKNVGIWFTPPVIVWLIASLLGIFVRVIKKKSRDWENLFLVFIVFTSALYLLTGINYTGFPKHFIVLMPFVALIFARDLYNITQKCKNRKNLLLILLGISLLLVLYYYFVVGEPIFTPDIWMIIPQFEWSIVWQIFLKIELILLPILVIAFFTKDLKKALIIVSVVFMLYAAAFTSSVTYATNVNYGDYGLDKVIKFMETETGGKISTIIAPYQFIFIWDKGEDTGFENNAYTYQVAYYYVYVDRYYDKMLKVPDRTYVIIYEHDIYRAEGFKEHLESNFDFIKKIGYYQIYKIKADENG